MGWVVDSGRGINKKKMVLFAFWVFNVCCNDLLGRLEHTSHVPLALLELEQAQNFLAPSCSGYLKSGSGFCQVDRKNGLSLSGPLNYSNLTLA